MPLPRRVLHVLRDDHAEHVGGDLVQVDAAVTGLRARGIDTVAATVADGPAEVDVVHAYNFWRPAELQRDLVAARRRWPAARVVVSPVWWPAAVGAAVRSRQTDVLVRTAKSAAKDLRWWATLRGILRSADLVVPNSEAEAVGLQRGFRVDGDERWTVVRYGVHLDRWPSCRADAAVRAATLERFGLDPAATVVVASVARVEPRKNQLAVLDAIDRIPGAVALLVGPDGEQPYAGRVDDAVGARAGRAARTGLLAPAEVAELLASTDVHVLASFWETLGLSTLEAAAVGCGVVVSAAGAAVEYLGDVATVADPSDPASVAAAVAAAASGARLTDAGRVALGWDRSIDDLVAAYDRLPATRS